MDTNNSKFTDCDLTEIRRQRDYSLSEKDDRQQNKELRKRISRRTRSREKQAFNKLLRDEDYDEINDFWRR